MPRCPSRRLRSISRPPFPYDRSRSSAGHIDGASSIPLTELDQRIGELPADVEIIAYCRGPFCAYAHEAVRSLRASGRSARRLADGVPEWNLAQENELRGTPACPMMA